MKSLRHAAGELLVVGLSGTELTGLERAWLGIVRPGGIILFRRNIHDAEQTRGLLDAATGVCINEALADREPWPVVTEEGQSPATLLIREGEKIVRLVLV